MPKFFVKHNQINENNIIILGEDVNHIINVLRMKVKDKINICDSENEINYIAQIEKFNKEEVICEVIKVLEDNTEPNTKITLFQGLPKFDKMELIIQKCTEIGVNKIVPVEMNRSIVKIKNNDKIERWNKISQIAAKQSMRNVIPLVENVKKLDDVINDINKFDIVFVAYENEKENTLKQELGKIKAKNKNQNIAIIIGPEGGFDDIEIQKLKKLSNASIVTLGKRILRTETAGLVMAGNILYELE